MELLVESYLPDRYQKYLVQNYQMTEEYRSYNDIVPDFLRSRPCSVIIHCLHRMRIGKRFKHEDIKELSRKGLFTVQSLSLEVHHVDLGVSTGKPSCTCKDWIRFNIPCKHFLPSLNIELNGVGILCQKLTCKALI